MQSAAATQHGRRRMSPSTGAQRRGLTPRGAAQWAPQRRSRAGAAATCSRTATASAARAAAHCAPRRPARPPARRALLGAALRRLLACRACLRASALQHLLLKALRSLLHRALRSASTHAPPLQPPLQGNLLLAAARIAPRMVLPGGRHRVGTLPYLAAGRRRCRSCCSAWRRPTRACRTRACPRPRARRSPRWSRCSACCRRRRRRAPTRRRRRRGAFPGPLPRADGRQGLSLPAHVRSCCAVQCYKHGSCGGSRATCCCCCRACRRTCRPSGAAWAPIDLDLDWPLTPHARARQAREAGRTIALLQCLQRLATAGAVAMSIVATPGAPTGRCSCATV